MLLTVLEHNLNTNWIFNVYYANKEKEITNMAKHGSTLIKYINLKFNQFVLDILDHF